METFSKVSKVSKVSKLFKFLENKMFVFLGYRIKSFKVHVSFMNVISILDAFNSDAFENQRFTVKSFHV